MLNFYLRHGLNAAQISVSLHRPPGTVRTQLARGLKLLRQALPASLIAGGVVLTSPVQGLAAMRELVLQKAVVTLAAESAAGTSSAFVLGKLGLWVGAGTLTAAGLAVSLMAPDEGQVTFDELSPKATASVVAQKGFVDSLAPASLALQADPFSPSSRVLMTISNPVPPPCARRCNYHDEQYKFPFLPLPEPGRPSPADGGHDPSVVLWPEPERDLLRKWRERD